MPDPARDVPAHETHVFAERRHPYCFIVFVLNEGEKFREQVRRMTGYADLVDVIVADGGSTDGSIDLPSLRADGVSAVLVKTGPGKLSAQMRMALAYALDAGYEGMVVVDGNGKDDVSALPLFLERLGDGDDHVQGSRFIPGGRAVNTPVSRLLGLRLLHAPLMSIASGTRQTDTTNGFRGYSTRLIADPEIAVFRPVFDSYELHHHLALEAGRLARFRTTEVPVTRSYPDHGPTPTKISPVRGNLRLLGILFRAVAGSYRLKPGRSS